MSNPGFFVYTKYPYYITSNPSQINFNAIPSTTGYNDNSFFNYSNSTATVPVVGVYSLVLKCTYSWNFSTNTYPSYMYVDINGKRMPLTSFNYVNHNDENTMIIQANVFLQQGDVVKAFINFGSLDLYNQIIYSDSYFGMQRLAD